MAVCGENSTLVVTEDGSLYSWGNGDFGQLGLGSEYNQLLPVRMGVFDKRVVMVATRGLYAAALLEDGSVYTWGKPYMGQLGHGDLHLSFLPSTMTPMRLDKELWGGLPAVQVSCGWAHTIVLTTDGRVFTCGDGENGKLGHGDTQDKSMPTQVEVEHFNGIQIVMVAAGIHHSVALGENGSVFTWGDGDCGCLGHNDEEERLVPTQLTVEAMRGARVVMMAAGDNYTVAVAQDGTLWVWGIGYCGQIGFESTKNKLVPTCIPVETFGDSQVLMVSCAFAHTLVVTEDGNVYSCGAGDYGCLGHNDKADRQLFTRIAPSHFGFAKIVSVSTGNNHSLAVTDDGALYTWGMGVGLGHGDGEDRLVPTRVAAHLLDNQRVGRYQGLRPEYAVALAMGFEDRLGVDCKYNSMPSEFLREIIETFMLHPEGPTQKLEGVIRLMGGGLKSDWRRKSLL